MLDMEKVVKGLEAHEKGCGYRSHYCDVVECPYRYGDESCDIEEMCHDALTLLKEQEPQSVIVREEPQNGNILWFADCPKCKHGIERDKHKNFCGFCGQAVKWNE